MDAQAANGGMFDATSVSRYGEDASFLDGLAHSTIRLADLGVLGWGFKIAHIASRAVVNVSIQIVPKPQIGATHISPGQALLHARLTG